VVWPHQFERTCVAIGFVGLSPRKKPIIRRLIRSSPFLKTFTDFAQTISGSKLFHLFTSRSPKKNFLNMRLFLEYHVTHFATSVYLYAVNKVIKSRKLFEFY